MAIIQGLATSFLAELFGGIQDMDTDTFNMALYTSAAILSSATTAYTATGEVAGAGYVAGGVAMTGGAIATSGTTAYVDFDDVAFAAVTITFRGALIYNVTKANRAVCVIDGGIDRSAVAQTVTAVMPAASASTALIRITA